MHNYSHTHTCREEEREEKPERRGSRPRSCSPAISGDGGTRERWHWLTGVLAEGITLPEGLAELVDGGERAYDMGYWPGEWCARPVLLRMLSWVVMVLAWLWLGWSWSV